MRSSVYNQTQRTPFTNEHQNGPHSRTHSRISSIGNHSRISSVESNPEPHHHRLTRRGTRSEASRAVSYQNWRRNIDAAVAPPAQSHDINPYTDPAIVHQPVPRLPPPTQQSAVQHPIGVQSRTAPTLAKTADELHLLSLLEQLGDFERKGRFLAQRVGEMMAASGSGQPPVVPALLNQPRPQQQAELPVLRNINQAITTAQPYTGNIGSPPHMPYFCPPGGSRPVAVLAPVAEEEELRNSLGSI